ncbi:predicted protein [Histoplasma capsulatum G186AR]|uniref:Uncharacterized protein n=1 Tax=Ajellomyces capsulatus (strain G186AR / H82 / ATCC MYA-2454 / RMSCC 2432) TaxID=447093 RepID=C0NL82_AJECG|nr:uncharacterized protein HCBG_03912 [Histoplasma capsulatum G186AR]EEH08623.1 predicted protein [Histoplasma capsulatum G186AR]
MAMQNQVSGWHTDQTAFFTSGGSSVGLTGPLEVTPPPNQGSAIPAPSQRQVPLVGFPPVAPRQASHHATVAISLLQDEGPVHTACGPWTRRGCCLPTAPTAPTVQPPSAGAGAGPDPRLWPGRRGVRAPLSAVIKGRHIPYEDYTLALFRTGQNPPRWPQINNLGSVQPSASKGVGVDSFIQFQFSPSWQSTSCGMTRAGCCESGKETTDSNCFRAPEELYGPLSLTRSTLRKSISVICISISTSTSIRIRTRPIEPRMKQKALKG